MTVKNKQTANLVPWDKVAPPYLSKRLEIFSNAQGATKELTIMLILPTVSTLLGLCKLQMTTTYSENLDLFTLGICLPLGGKNQCFSFGCKPPISFAESRTAACLLDKFTKVGLQKHLLQNGGEGLLMNEEMENTLRHIFGGVQYILLTVGWRLTYTSTLGEVTPDERFHDLALL